MIVPLAAVLAVSGAVLTLVSVRTARPPEAPLPDVDGYLDGWQALHGGHDPRGSVWVRRWLVLGYRLARPLARRGVSPSAVTAWSAWLGVGVLLPAAAAGPWLLLAGGLVVLSSLTDAVDGGVAVLTGRATRFGYVLDSMVDRANELAYLAAVVLAGGPILLACACAVVFLLHDYLRARAANAGAGEVVAVTVGERATRVIVLAATLLVAGGLAGHAGDVAALGLWVLLVLSIAGFAQLMAAVHRVLRTPGR